MDHVLFDVLEPRDLVRLGLCNSNMFRKCPFARLYFTVVTTTNCQRIRRLKSPSLPVFDLTRLTHLDIPEITTAMLQVVPNLKYLKLERCRYDLVLPSKLQTFIGRQIEQHLTVPESLTHLSIRDCRTVNYGAMKIVGLDNHPNLTILRFANMYDNIVDFEIPPNLVTFDMPDMSRALTTLPPSLRSFRLMADYHYPLPDLPVLLEEFGNNAESSMFAPFPKLPCGLRILGLPPLFPFSELQALRLSECAKLTKIVVNWVSSSELKNVMDRIDRQVPDVRDLEVYGDFISDLYAPFTNLTRLTMGTITNNCKHIDLGTWTQIIFFSFFFTFSRNASLTLPPNLKTLKLDQGKDYNSGRFITMNLPTTLRNISVIGNRAFHIRVSRAHLARLEIVGDRGSCEKDGQIKTTWGKFLLCDE